MTAPAHRVRRNPLAALRPVALEMAGIALIVVGAFSICQTAGYVVAGLACFAVNWMVQE